MTDKRKQISRSDPGNRRTRQRAILTVIGLALLCVPLFSSTPVQAMTSFTAGTPDPGITLNCSNAVMTTAPKFLSNPKGSAKYPFKLSCISPQRPGVMNVVIEGSWTPTETRRDRPNASETVTITGFGPFIPGREDGPGVKIVMYWTGSCTADPWLQGGTCSRFGEYIPDDLRPAFSNFVSKPFPLTGNSISASLKQQLVKQYQQANQPASQRSNNQQSMFIQSPQSQSIITQSQRIQSMTVQPQAALPKPSTGALARSGIFARGVEEKEGEPPSQQVKDAQAESVETSDAAILEEGTPELVEPTSIQLDRVLYILTAKPDAIVLKPGAYEVGIVMDLQLGLAKEGQPTVLLNARQGTHTESITRSVAFLLPGQQDDRHLVLLTPDGRRFDAVGTTTGVMSRGSDKAATVPSEGLKQAVVAAAKPRSVPSPACQPNPNDTGPRWIPVPCTIAATPASGSTP